MSLIPTRHRPVKTVFVLNPRAGKNLHRPKLREQIGQFIRDHNLDATIELTTARGHAIKLARTAAMTGTERVVAVGGDGTMNEVAQGIVGTSTILGLIPCGSGNGLALHLGLPTTIDQAMQLLVNPTAMPIAIDTGVANGHPFFNAMGVGFDAEIGARFNRLTRRGLRAYIRTTLSAITSFVPSEMRVDYDGRQITSTATMIAVCNSDQYGNNAFIAPGARVSDGFLNLTLIPKVNLWQSCVLAARLFLGSIHRHKGVVCAEAETFTIHRDSPGLIHTDGETHLAEATVNVKVQKASLWIWVPQKTGLRLRTPHPVAPDRHER